MSWNKRFISTGITRSFVGLRKKNFDDHFEIASVYLCHKSWWGILMVIIHRSRNWRKVLKIITNRQYKVAEEEEECATLSKTNVRTCKYSSSMKNKLGNFLWCASAAKTSRPGRFCGPPKTQKPGESIRPSFACRPSGTRTSGNTSVVFWNRPKG